MCGLAGIILKDKNRSSEMYDVAGEIVSSLLVSASSRGRHATGVALIERDGDSMIRKAPLPASVFTITPNYKEAMKSIDGGTGAVIGHTRYATQGSPQMNRNNHPIKAGSIIGTHNGMIRNDDELFEAYDLERYAQVDSEVLFRMLDNAPNMAEFKDNMLPQVEGMVSMVWADVEFPNHIYVYKGNNPLEMVYLKEYKMFAYASTRSILIDGLVRVVPDATIQTVKLDDWTLARIDVSNLKMKKTVAKINMGARKTTPSRATTNYMGLRTPMGGSAIRFKNGGNNPSKSNSHKDMCESMQTASDGSQIRLFNHKNNNKRSK